MDPQASVTGIVIINDIGGADMNLVKNLNPAFMKKSMTIFQVISLQSMVGNKIFKVIFLQNNTFPSGRIS